MPKEVRKLPESLEVKFIICDNTLNRKGWRLLVEGIDMEGFSKNPVCIVQHSTWSIPIGKWKDLEVSNGQFLGTVEFDKNDEEAVKLYWKYIDGYMNAVSLHIIPIEESDDPAYLVKGQRYSTITKSELLEVSLVTIPGQKNAVRLSTPEGLDYKLNIINNHSKKMEEEKKQTENEVAELRKQLDEQRKLNALNLIELHKQRGVVEKEEEEHLEKLAMLDYDSVKKMLEARNVKKEEEKPEEKAEETGKDLSAQLQAFLQQQGEKKPGREDWTYLDWYKKDLPGLMDMQKTNPDLYKRLEAVCVKESEAKGIKIEE
jgi:phage head maturation protease